jgi:hypothetical protein
MKSRRDLGAIAGIIAAVYIVGWLVAMRINYATNPVLVNSAREATQIMIDHDPRRVSYKEWKKVMGYWTDTGDKEYSKVMSETQREKVYDKLRNPLKTKIQHYCIIMYGFVYLSVVIGGAAWIAMELEARLSK